MLINMRALSPPLQGFLRMFPLLFSLIFISAILPVSAQYFSCEGDGVADSGSGQRIPLSFVNDDFCDCENGADEFFTSACPGASFLCRGRYTFPHTIPSGHVRDGICDCCDGEDEMGDPSVQCPDRCLELAFESLAAKKAELEEYIIGVEATKGLGEAIKEKRSRAIGMLRGYEGQLSSLSKHLNELNEQIKEDGEELGLLKMRHRKVLRHFMYLRSIYQQMGQMINAKMGPGMRFVALFTLLFDCFEYHYEERQYGIHGVDIDHYLIQFCPLRNITQTSLEDPSLLPGTMAGLEGAGPEDESESEGTPTAESSDSSSGPQSTTQDEGEDEGDDEEKEENTYVLGMFFGQPHDSNETSEYEESLALHEQRTDAELEVGPQESWTYDPCNSED